MDLTADRSPLRHPAAVAARLLLWPLLVAGGAWLLARTQSDALAAGLSAFVAIMAIAFVLSLADGLVLRVRPLVLVWSVVTVLTAVVVSFQPVTDVLLGGDGTLSASEAVRDVLTDLPSSLVLFLLLVGVPAALGALSGGAIRRSRRPHDSRATLPAGLTPRA